MSDEKLSSSSLHEKVVNANVPKRRTEAIRLLKIVVFIILYVFLFFVTYEENIFMVLKKDKNFQTIFYLFHFE